MARKAPRRKVSDLEISRWMIKLDGKVSAVAKQLDVTVGTIYRRMNNSPKIQARLEDAHEKTIDKAQSVVDMHLDNGSLKAATYVLDNKGGRQGYGAKAKESQEEKKVETISLAQIDTSDMDTEAMKLLLKGLMGTKKKLEEEGE
ncbi:hypothetical protein CL634_07030 [bacterium]|nr:hypothetical protein [bacterium]|tara:strand:+ start:132 stop:566 length:435 start_codon:yes stop_codon:yes gene_type:complete